MTLSERALPEQIGRYRIIRLLGQGAMGRVLLAHDPVLDRDVAIKLLRADLNIAPDQRRDLFDRMRQEARASARVSHPGIVALHDMGEDEIHGLFLVFEYVEGWSLKEKLTRGPLGVDAAARLATEIGSALSTAHAAGVLHRDIKPENVILCRTGAKIADFGIARVPDSTLTRDGGLLGTPAYSAPEAIAQSQFSPSSDQFSMAATLYEAISRKRAFPGEDAVTVASRIATEQPTPIAELCALDTHVDAVLYRALAKDPRARFTSCDDFGRALAEALQMSPRAKMTTLPDQYHLRARRSSSLPRSLFVGAVGATFGSLATLAAANLISARAEPNAVAPPPPSDTGQDAIPVAWLAPRPPSAQVVRVSKPHAPRPARDVPRDAGAEEDAAEPDLADPETDAALAPPESVDSVSTPEFE